VETSRLSSKGQVTLPKKVRTAIGARPGDTIIYDITEDGVRLRRAEPLDLAFHSALEHTLDEWTTAADEEAFGDL
jgi:antitoxin PrlF